MRDTTLVALIDCVALNDPLAEFVDDSVELDDTDAEWVDDIDAEAQREVKALVD